MLVRDAIRDTYPDIVARIGDPDLGAPGRWVPALVALTSRALVGVGLAQRAVVTDLWVARPARGRGVGAALLAALEARVASEGHSRARLRCVATNTRARAFYRRAGWHVVGQHAHERFGHPMVDFAKRL